MSKLSIELRLTLASWLADATAAKPSDTVKNSGLCGYVQRFGSCDQYYELSEAFHAEGLSLSTPFNSTGLWGPKGYFTEKGKLHKNTQRLAWVRKHLKMEEQA